MITITLDDQAVRAALDDLARRVSDTEPAMRQIGEALLEGVKTRIEQGRDWTGRPFAPNSAATLARKKGARPLIDRGDFLGSRLHYAAGRDQVEVGSSAVQAAVLQFGAKRGEFGRTRRGAPIPWGDIPARPYLPIGPGDTLEPEARRLVLDTLSDWLADAGR